jgi:hypothetical protein
LLVAVVEERAVKMLQLVLVVAVVAWAAQALQALELQLLQAAVALAVQAHQELEMLAYHPQNGVEEAGKAMALPTPIISWVAVPFTVVVAAVVVAVGTIGLAWMVVEAEFGQQGAAALVVQQALLEAQEQMQALSIPLALAAVGLVAKILLATVSLAA